MTTVCCFGDRCDCAVPPSSSASANPASAFGNTCLLIVESLPYATSQLEPQPESKLKHCLVFAGAKANAVARAAIAADYCPFGKAGQMIANRHAHGAGYCPAVFILFVGGHQAAAFARAEQLGATANRELLEIVTDEHEGGPKPGVNPFAAINREAHDGRSGHALRNEAC